MSIQKDFTMSVDLFNKSVEIPNHPAKIIFNNCLDNKLSFNLRSDPQQTLEQNFNQNLRICTLCNIEPNLTKSFNKSFYPFKNIIDPTAEKDINILKFNF